VEDYEKRKNERREIEKERSIKRREEMKRNLHPTSFACPSNHRRNSTNNTTNPCITPVDLL
jgi:hypothetical protein